MGTGRRAMEKTRGANAGRAGELIELSRVTRRMTFEQKLRLMEEAARILRKGRSMKDVLRQADEVWGRSM